MINFFEKLRLLLNPYIATPRLAHPVESKIKAS
ncbi:MAG: hypothetical protein ACFWT6_05475 [Virgibacillus proomii]